MTHWKHRHEIQKKDPKRHSRVPHPKLGTLLAAHRVSWAIRSSESKSQSFGAFPRAPSLTKIRPKVPPRKTLG